MLLIQEQTAFFELDKVKKQNIGIKLANSCVAN